MKTHPIRTSRIHSRRQDSKCIEDCMACSYNEDKGDFWEETDDIWGATPFDQESEEVNTECLDNTNP